MSDPVARLNAALSGRYTIERELGEGGMATVYLADDVKHHRKVALKVLKPELAAVVGAERFLAEIQVTANLTHPHILPLHDSGEADSFLFYVMPYLEGETLQDRIDREKQLPVDEAVRIAIAVANALDHAHRHKVIHRDIKPANILLQDGEPVVADFGIALAVGEAGATRLTETGLSLGIPFYMSPEQATGDQPVGASTDTYALGSVLYEMLVGEPPYLGNTAQAVLGKIIAGKPVSATEQRPSIPANVDAAVRKSLEKLPADRFRSAQDFVHALTDEHFRYGELPATAGPASPWNGVSKAATSIATLLAVALGRALMRPDAPGPIARFAIPTPDGPAFSERAIILPDGSGMLYQAPGPSGADALWIRRWTEIAAAPIAGTDRVSDGGWLSPDGEEVAFSVRTTGPAGPSGPIRRLRVTSLSGGAVRTIAEDARCPCVWTEDASSIFYSDGRWGIRRVPANGGESVTTTEGEEPVWRDIPLAHLAGQDVLPFRHYMNERRRISEIRAVRLSDGSQTTILDGSSPAAVVDSDRLMFGTVDGDLMAAPFDPVALATTGAPVLMLEGVATSTTLNALASVSRDGSLLYLPGRSGNLVTAVWVDRSGAMEPVDPGWSFPGTLVGSSLAMSPDGSRFAVSIPGEGLQLWIKELEGGPATRFSFEGVINRRPDWSPDGATLYFTSDRLDNYDLFARPADMSEPAELLLDLDRNIQEAIVTPNGEWIIFRQGTSTGGGANSNLYAMRPGADTTRTVLVDADSLNQAPALSPDGRWLAYTSNESGIHEIYVRPFPETDRAIWHVSEDQGTEPVWHPEGHTLFYRGATHVTAAVLRTEPSFSVVERRPLFPTSGFMSSDGHQMYDIHPDGERFLMLRRGGAAANALILVQN